jgi:hypothetical protein
MTDVAIDVDSVLIWGLKAQTGADVQPNGVEEGTTAPYIVYKRISDRIQDRAHGQAGAIHLGRFQFTMVASSFGNLRTLVSSVGAFLEGNTTNFSASLSDDLHFEDKEAEDIYVAVRDYIIQWRQA